MPHTAVSHPAAPHLGVPHPARQVQTRRRTEVHRACLRLLPLLGPWEAARTQPTPLHRRTGAHRAPPVPPRTPTSTRHKERNTFEGFDSDERRPQERPQEQLMAQFMAFMNLQEERRREEDIRRQQEETRRIEMLMTRLASPSQASHMPPSYNPPTNPPAARPRTQISLPDKLPVDANVAVFKAWKRKWDDYVVLTDLNTHPQGKQMAQLRQALSDGIQNVIRHNLLIPDDTNRPLGEVLAEVESYVKSHSNQAARRLAFNRCKQDHGEDFDNFTARARQAAIDADLCTTCSDTRILDQIICGVTDDELRTQLLTRQEDSLEEAIKFARNYLVARKTSTDITNQADTDANALSQYRRSKGAKGKAQSQNTPNKSDPCPYCGGNTPHLRKDRTKCPAWSVPCKSCNTKGHFETVCRRDKSKSEKTELSTIVLNTTIGDKTCPRIVTSVQVGTKATEIKFIPDTGAELTAIPEAMMKELKITEQTFDKSKIRNVKAANGSAILHLGCTPVKISYMDRQIDASLNVLDPLPNSLLSWYDTRELGIIPKDFPKPIGKEITTSQISASPEVATNIEGHEKAIEELSQLEPSKARVKLLQDFEDVLVFKKDLENKPLKPMSGPPMQIHVDEDAIPVKLHNARVIPLAFQAKTKEALDKLVSQGIIEPVGGEITDWCSPCVPIIKPNGEVRVTVDHKHLNEYVKRPSHPSSSAYSKLRQIKPGAKYFTTMDCLQGYHQIEIDEKSRNYTCFITPWGRYRHLRAPMGLRSSGDEFCRRTDEALSGINDMIKQMDDMLAWDADYKEHVKHVYLILATCRRHNITLNADKFQFAETAAKWCGYVVDEKGGKCRFRQGKSPRRFPHPR